MPALLVVGSAPCLHDDLKAARDLYPDAHVMLVNGACVAVEEAEHVLAGHREKAEQFAEARRTVFPFAMPWRLHANGRKLDAYRKAQTPSVTDWWGVEMSTGATSIGKGARIGLALGYSPIILCGAPMDGSGYFPREPVVGKSIRHDCRRIGHADQQSHRTIQGYRAKFVRLAAGEFKGKVFSMSGFTRECLGHPQDFLCLQ